MPAANIATPGCIPLHSPQSHSKLYTALCLALSDRLDQVDWAAFSPAEWEALPRLALAEGVAPLLYAKLKGAGCGSQIPEPVMGALAMAYYRTAANNALLFDELKRILAALDAAGIPVIVLKGAALAQTVYPDPALRPMGDVDLLIREVDLPTITQMMDTMGYHLEHPELWPGLTRLYAYELNFDRTLNGVPMHIEFHWNLIGGESSIYRPDIAWFWEQSQPVNGFTVLMPEAHLLYLAAHTYIKHALTHRRLIWFYDMAQIVQLAPLDWQLLVQKSKQFQWFLPLAAAVRYLQGSLGLIWSPIICSFFPCESLPENIETRVFDVHRSFWKFALSTLKPLHWSARLKLIFALLFPSPVYMKWRYKPRPTWIWPLYYFYRWRDPSRPSIGL